ncbi:unnamed protein product [Amoebophrya sp. A120]|nr:unnamed protein product [Amoebophrya sp. A120]|eukprot:GSA120T00006018001.1
MDFAVCFPAIDADLKGLLEWKHEITTQLKDKDTEIEKLKTDLEAAQGEIEKLKTDMEAQKGDAACTETLDTLDKRVKELEAMDVNTLRTDFDVRWGEVKPELEKVADFVPRLAQQDLKIAEAEAKSTTAKEKCDDFEVRVTKIDNEWAAYQKDERKLQDVITKFDDGIKRVEGQQLEMDAKYSRKYQQMWNEVPKALEEMNGRHIEQLEKQLQTNAADKVAEVQNLVKYCLQILSRVQSEKKSETDQKNLLLAWREQSWINARRRMGMEQLRKFLKSRIKDPFQTWKVQAMYETTIKRITAEYTRRIPDVPKQLDELGFPAKIESLQDHISKLSDEKAGKDEVAEEISSTVSKIDAKAEELDQLREEFVDHKGVTETLEGGISAAKELVTSVEKKAGSAESRVEQLKQAIEANYAQNTEVQAMVKDVLLIWYSIKQLDATKADKKDMEAYALESINREKANVRQEVIEKNEEMKGELGSMQGNVEEIGRGFNEQQGQFVSLQQMLGNLASFVEELVVKIAEMQGVEVTGGAEKEAKSMTNMEDMEQWLHYAKGVVDQSLDNYHGASSGATGGMGGNLSRAGNNSSRGRQPRPKSAASMGMDGAQVSGRGLSTGRNGAAPKRRM